MNYLKRDVKGLFSSTFLLEQDFKNRYEEASCDIELLARKIHERELDPDQAAGVADALRKDILYVVGAHPLRFCQWSRVKNAERTLTDNLVRGIDEAITQVYRERMEDSRVFFSERVQKEYENIAFPPMPVQEPFLTRPYYAKEHVHATMDAATASLFGACVLTTTTLLAPVVKQLVPGLEDVLQDRESVAAFFALTWMLGAAAGNAYYLRNHAVMPDA